jgi:hypothetical protein
MQRTLFDRHKRALGQEPVVVLVYFLVARPLKVF